jgi:hypothetical protein
MSESDKELSMNLNHVLVLLMAARGTMNPKFLPDEKDDSIPKWKFWKKPEYETFWRSAIFLVDNHYITPDLMSITDKGIVYIENILKTCAKVHMAIADYANMDEMMKASENLAGMFTKQPTSEVYMEEDAKRGLDEED